MVEARMVNAGANRGPAAVATSADGASARRVRPVRRTARRVGLLLAVLPLVVSVVAAPTDGRATAETGYGWAVSAVTSAPTVVRAKTVTVTANIKASTARTGVVIISIRDPAGRSVMRRVSAGAQFQANVVRRFTATWVVPRSEPLGLHSLHVSVRRTHPAGPTLRYQSPTGIRVVRAAVACGASAAIRARASLPLHVVKGRRDLVGANGVPFLMQGDAAWSLIVQLTREQADGYLQDRANRGFNTVLVNLIEHRFS